MSKQIRGILFDKDGTLLDFNNTWLPPYRIVADYVANNSNGKITADGLLAAGGYIARSNTWQPDSLLAAGSNQQIIQSWGKLIEREFTQEELQHIAAIFKINANKYVPVIDPLRHPLERLRRQGYFLGLATMDDESNAHTMTTALNIADLLDFVCGADSGFGVKPTPGMILGFADQVGITSEQVAMVGDSPRDIRMGINANAGMSIGVLTGAHDREELEQHTDIVLQDIGELLNLLVG